MRITVEHNNYIISFSFSSDFFLLCGRSLTLFRLAAHARLLSPKPTQAHTCTHTHTLFSLSLSYKPNVCCVITIISRSYVYDLLVLFVGDDDEKTELSGDGRDASPLLLLLLFCYCCCCCVGTMSAHADTDAATAAAATRLLADRESPPPLKPKRGFRSSAHCARSWNTNIIIPTSGIVITCAVYTRVVVIIIFSPKRSTRIIIIILLYFTRSSRSSTSRIRMTGINRYIAVQVRAVKGLRNRFRCNRFIRPSPQLLAGTRPSMRYMVYAVHASAYYLVVMYNNVWIDTMPQPV